MVSCRDRRIMRNLGLLAVVVACALMVAGLAQGVLFLGPALLLVLPLLAGRYVGEDVVVALATLRVAARRPAPRLSARLPRAPRAVRPRGGRLLAASLAERGPPALRAR